MFFIKLRHSLIQIRSFVSKSCIFDLKLVKKPDNYRSYLNEKWPWQQEKYCQLYNKRFSNLSSKVCTVKYSSSTFLSKNLDILYIYNGWRKKVFPLFESLYLIESRFCRFSSLLKNYTSSLKVYISAYM